MHEETVLAVFTATARRQAQAPALRAKRSGSWQTVTWEQYEKQVRLVARGFLALGLSPRKAVVILGYNRPEWFLADLGAIAAGGVPAGIYTTNTPEQCRYIAAHAEAEIAVVENAEQLAKLRAVRGELPELRSIVVMEGTPDGKGGPGELSWSELLARGEAHPETELEARLTAQGPDDPATLIYTSGTTGDPKAVTMTHRNITWTARAVVSQAQITADEVVLSYLPLSHIAEQIVSLHCPIAAGACTWFAESLEKLPENLREARPTFFFAVPRVWEKMQAAIQAAGAQAPPLRRKIAAWAKRQGLAGGYAEQQGRSKPLLYPLADRLVFSKVRHRLGLDRARFCCVSAAPIARDTLEFFLSLGIPILEVYGMSECTGPTTLSLPNRYRTGKAGFALPGTELAIAEDGEVLMRGPHVFAGYYKNPAATAETVDAEGWLHSGDIGSLDADGFLAITDRKKELIITSGGKNVGPAILEAKLKQIPMVAQAVVVGDRRNYLAALLVLDPAWITTQAATLGSQATDLPSAARCPVLRARLDAELAKVNQGLARYEQIRRFAVLPAELTIAGDELTPTMKLKRRVIHQKYAETIEGLYQGSAD
jgi:long-subunit acyl-CoA synthetase (AMP-forming)